MGRHPSVNTARLHFASGSDDMIEFEVKDNKITATMNYDTDKLLPAHHEFIRRQIESYLSRVKVQSECNCPNDCKYYKGHKFRLFTTPTTWAEAEAACKARGGHLATSTSADKNAFLTNMAGSTRVWLGGTDEGTEGTWRWITGEEWGYTSWGAGQPDNAGGAEHYLELNYGTIGKWNDISATANLSYICECEYEPRIVINPKDISHSALSDDEEQYHLTTEEKSKLEKLMPAD